MARILVTGGAGMIGANLVMRLVRNGHDVFIADNLWRGRIENLRQPDGNYVVDLERRFFLADLRSHDECLTITRDIEVVYHLADIVAGINFVFANQLFLWRNNVLINTNILNSAIVNRVKKYIYAGTACSYPKSMQSYLNPPPLKEEDVYPAEPESAYGWSKLMGEYEAELAREAGAIDVGILRLHNVYGPPCELDPERSQVIPALCRKAICYPHEPFIVWGSGNQRRAFLYVDDVVDALLRLLDRGINKGAIQVGPDCSISIREIAEKIVKLSGKNIEIAYDTSKPEGDIDRTADWSKAHAVLGWTPVTSIDDGLEKTFAWCKEQLKG